MKEDAEKKGQCSSCCWYRFPFQVGRFVFRRRCSYPSVGDPEKHEACVGRCTEIVERKIWRSVEVGQFQHAPTSIRLSIFAIASKSFSPGFSVHVFSQELCLFLRTKQRIIQMQILICNPTNHVTQSLITRNVCRRFERIVLTIR